MLFEQQSILHHFLLYILVLKYNLYQDYSYEMKTSEKKFTSSQLSDCSHAPKAGNREEDEEELRT